MITTKEAIGQLTKALREDPEYYYSWQANIAMAFYDEVMNTEINKEFEAVGLNINDNIHKTANNAAKNFLNQLMYEKHDTVQNWEQGDMETIP